MRDGRFETVINTAPETATLATVSLLLPDVNNNVRLKSKPLSKYIANSAELETLAILFSVQLTGMSRRKTPSI